jgi:hypothetical protein
MRPLHLEVFYDAIKQVVGYAYVKNGFTDMFHELT